MKNISESELVIYGNHYANQLPGGDEGTSVGAEDDDMAESSDDDDAITLPDDESGDDEDIDYDGTPVPTEEELEEDIFTTDDIDEI